MSHFTDRLFFFRRNVEGFSDGHGIVTNEDRSWEDAYRNRWAYDKVVRSTHGVNCTGSCSWKVYVKGGIVTWETQATDYPRTRPDLPNHEPRGCPRGASYSWYLYSGNRLKYPMVRGRLVRMWREARSRLSPVEAWASIVEDSAKSANYKQARGLGGFVRCTWEEANEIVAAANVYTIKKYGPDRIAGFSPIPAMSMVSQSSGMRYLSLIGGVALSFYDWYCDLPPSSPQTWGEQTDVPESADWYNSRFLMLWGSNVPQTRTPDAHFYTEARYNGTQSVVVSPDYSEASKFADIWLHPKQGTDAAVGLAMGHVILKEFHVDRPSKYFTDYVRRFSDLPFLVRLDRVDEHRGPGRGSQPGAGMLGRYRPGYFLRASEFEDALGETNNPEWKPVAIDEATDLPVVPLGSAGFRWGEEGKWNLDAKESSEGHEVDLRLSAAGTGGETAEVEFPYFGSREHDYFTGTEHPEVLVRVVPVRRIKLAVGEALVSTAYDLLLANYGVDRGLGGENVAKTYEDDVPYTPAWQERITGVKRDLVVKVAREFANVADRTEGRSMVILGAGLNHWYNMDMSYRAIINLLVLCGCVGKPGGGWSHYVGQEKLRPQTGWTTVAFALDWHRPPRHMNGTSFFYAHTDQWRYETLRPADLLSPTAPAGDWQASPIDFNVRAERMGWLPSAPHFDRSPLEIVKDAESAGSEPAAYVVRSLKDGSLHFASEDPDNPANFPRNFFVWRSNILGSSGKGHEYFLRHFLDAPSGIIGAEMDPEKDELPKEVLWHPDAPKGKLDLLVTIDFRMSTTCLYSDVVLPTATWYEKNDLSTTDMHTFVHPFSKAVDPAWQCRNDWEIYKGIAKAFSKVAEGVLGKERDLVATAIAHDSPGELAQPFDPREWKKGECEPVPGKTMPGLAIVERDYPATYDRYTTLGPLVRKVGIGGKGIAWKSESEVELLGRLNGTRDDKGAGGVSGLPKIESDIDAAEAILTLAPETNGHVAAKAWEALSKKTGRDHSHLAATREEEKIRFRDIEAQPRRTITSPIWSGLDDEEITYNAGYTNVHELIPWRTLTGRQQLYQDHLWMRAFGEALCVYKTPIAARSVNLSGEVRSNGQPEIVLNFITPHQKWGIHSTYSENLLMQTLSRGGPIVWVSEIDAKKIGLEDNDWIELYNANGALTARAVVSQRVNEGMCLMYHAQEKLLNIPGSEITNIRGGIHNSVTRTMVKPTHMIGGYAQLSYGLNYYGTVGSNRDEFVILRKMAKVDWLDEPAKRRGSAEAKR